MQLDIGSKLKLTLSLGLPRTIFSLILACDHSNYDFQLDVNFVKEKIVLGAQNGRNRKKDKGPLPTTIKSLFNQEFSVVIRTFESSFIVAVTDVSGDGVETEYAHPFPLCKARYLLLYGSRDIHSIKFGGVFSTSMQQQQHEYELCDHRHVCCIGLPLMPIGEGDEEVVASILYSKSFIQLDHYIILTNQESVCAIRQLCEACREVWKIKRAKE